MNQPPETRKLMYVFNGLPVRSGHELVSAMRQDWTAATDLLDNWPEAALKEWLRTRPDGDILILALDMEKSGGARLIRLQAEYDPDGPLDFQGVRIDEESLDRAIGEADPFTPETGADLARFIQIEIQRPRLNARVEAPRPSLSSQLVGNRLDPIARDIVNEIDSIEKDQLQRARDQLQSMEEEIMGLQASPAVKAYRWLSDIRTDRILRSLAAVVEGPAAARLLHADNLLREWSKQTDSFLNTPVFSLHRDFWMGKPQSGEGDRSTDDLLRAVEMASAAVERPRMKLAYLFAAALAHGIPTDESTRAIESAGSLLETINAIEEVAPVSGRGGYRSRTRDAEVREKQERLRQSVKELATQIHRSSPTDLGRLVPALPVMEALGIEIKRDLAELQAKRRREAEERAQHEHEEHAAQQLADQEAKEREALVEEELARFAELGRQDREWRASDLQTRVASLAGQAEVARANATAIERHVAELQTRATVLRDRSRNQLEDSQRLSSVQSEIKAAQQDLIKIEVGTVARQLTGLEAGRVKAIADRVQRLASASGTPDERKLEAAESEVWTVEQLIEKTRWDRQRIAHATRRLDAVTQLLASNAS